MDAESDRLISTDEQELEALKELRRLELMHSLFPKATAFDERIAEVKAAIEARAAERGGP